ncbi:MAG: transglutaminase family protein, partial [Acidimicrobiia bacterium]|nr:transglutaminase family protein [Acidimicrobiia bacterium]
IDVATHAWVEASIPEWGWWGIDPTNGYPAGERHVVVGRGRDYDDVAPLRGVYYGESDHALAATVRMSTQTVSAMPAPQVDQ